MFDDLVDRALSRFRSERGDTRPAPASDDPPVVADPTTRSDLVAVECRGGRRVLCRPEDLVATPDGEAVVQSDAWLVAPPDDVAVIEEVR